MKNNKNKLILMALFIIISSIVVVFADPSIPSSVKKYYQSIDLQGLDIFRVDDLYLDDGDTNTLKLGVGSMSADANFLFPVTQGAIDQVLLTNDAVGNSVWGSIENRHISSSAAISVSKIAGVNTTFSEKSANYTITDSDEIRYVLCNTSGADRTISLPTAADNVARVIGIKAQGSNLCTVDGDDGPGAIDGALAVSLEDDDYLQVISNGTIWYIIAERSTRDADGIKRKAVTFSTSVAANTEVLVPWGTQDYNYGGITYSTSTKKYTITKGGVWDFHIKLCGSFSNTFTAGSSFRIRFYHNGTLKHSSRVKGNDSTGLYKVGLSFSEPMAADDTVHVAAYQTTSNSATLPVTNTETSFIAFRRLQ